MDTRKIQFLKAVIGEDGGRALAKAAAQSADLEWAILPRVIMAWLEVVGEGQYQDHLPGVQGANLTFKKSESGFVGSIDIGDDVYTFVDASLNHVAGSVAVALGADPRAPSFAAPSSPSSARPSMSWSSPGPCARSLPRFTAERRARPLLVQPLRLGHQWVRLPRQRSSPRTRARTGPWAARSSSLARSQRSRR